LKPEGLKRMALHAWRMAFRHPLTAVPLECIAPLPDSIRSCIVVADARSKREFSADNLEQILAGK
jgi:23S rRNA pseudouridine955/2504/2580 synthase